MSELSEWIRDASSEDLVAVVAGERPEGMPIPPMRNRDSLAGLTKREAAAIAAMQGMMRMETSESDPHDIANLAVRQADALFDALERAKGETE